MGSDELAVVDPRLRVRGLAGLRVADASAIPRIPRGHTNLTTMIVAEKAADLIHDTAGQTHAGAELPLAASAARD